MFSITKLERTDKNSKYFNLHFHDHSYREDPGAYTNLISCVEKDFGDSQISFLDDGCGKGTFLRQMKEAFPQAGLTGVDTAENMLEVARQKVPQAELRNVRAFELDQLGRTFDVIHMGSLLHHLIGPSRKASASMASQMVELALSMTADGGMVVIDEVHYESFLHIEMTASVIFHGLKILNKLQLDMSRYMPEIQLGLEVSFFSERQLVQLARKFVGDNFEVVSKNHWPIPAVYRLFLLKDLGSICVVLHKE